MGDNGDITPPAGGGLETKPILFAIGEIGGMVAIDVAGPADAGRAADATPNPPMGCTGLCC